MKLLNKYIVTIEEVVSDDFEILAESKDTATQIAIDKYNTGELILEPGKLLSKQLQIHNTENDEQTEWIEF